MKKTYLFCLNLRKEKYSYHCLFASSITDKIPLNEAAAPNPMGIQSYGFSVKCGFCCLCSWYLSIMPSKTSCFSGNILKTLVFFQGICSKSAYFSPLYGKHTLPQGINQDWNYPFPGGEWMRGSNVSLLTIVPFPQHGHIRGSIPVSLINNSSHFKEQTIESLLYEMLPRSGFVQLTLPK